MKKALLTGVAALSVLIASEAHAVEQRDVSGKWCMENFLSLEDTLSGHPIISYVPYSDSCKSTIVEVKPSELVINGDKACKFIQIEPHGDGSNYIKAVCNGHLLGGNRKRFLKYQEFDIWTAIVPATGQPQLDIFVRKAWGVSEK